jgi:hypothetical protein
VGSITGSPSFHLGREVDDSLFVGTACIVPVKNSEIAASPGRSGKPPLPVIKKVPLSRLLRREIQLLAIKALASMGLSDSWLRLF